MRPILFVLFILLSSNLSAQNNFRPLNHLAMDINLSSEIGNKPIVLLEGDSPIKQNHSILNLGGQAILGSAFAVGFSFLPLAATWANAWARDHSEFSQTALGLLSISAYLFGAASGVHLIAKGENPELSYWGTLGYSAIGGGAGAVLLTILAAQNKHIPEVGGTIVALSPVIGSMIYASLISDWPKENQEVAFYKTIVFHKDLIEQAKLFNLELLRVKL